MLPWEVALVAAFFFALGYAVGVVVERAQEVEEKEWRLEFLHRWVHKQLHLPPPEDGEVIGNPD